MTEQCVMANIELTPRTSCWAKNEQCTVAELWENVKTVTILPSPLVGHGDKSLVGRVWNIMLGFEWNSVVGARTEQCGGRV